MRFKLTCSFVSLFSIILLAAHPCSTQTHEIQNSRLLDTPKNFQGTIINYDDKIYTVQTYIGNQGPFKLVIDTGSSMTWVQKKGTEYNNKNAFDCTASPTCEQKGGTKKLRYERGTAEGTYITEQIKFGVDQTPLTNQQIMVVENVTYFDMDHVDGILGLGPRPEDNKFLVEDMKEAGLISKASFSIFLNKGSNHPKGALVFGEHNDRYLPSTSSAFSYAKRTKDYYWSTGLKGMQFGSKKIELGSVTKAVIDSGSSVAMFPKNIFEQLLPVFDDNTIPCKVKELTGMIECGCNQFTKFPTFTFSLEDGFDLTLEKTDYVFDQGTDTCYIFINQQSTEKKGVVLGDSFLQNYYVDFDAENQRIGFSARFTSLTSVQDINNYLIVVVLVILVLCYLRSERKSRNASSQGQTLQQQSSSSTRVSSGEPSAEGRKAAWLQMAEKYEQDDEEGKGVL